MAAGQGWCEQVPRAHKYVHINLRGFVVTVPPVADRKRPVNLTISEGIVALARAYTDNLSATTERLLWEFVQQEQRASLEHQRLANACADGWNAVDARLGSFPDEHSIL